MLDTSDMVRLWRRYFIRAPIPLLDSQVVINARRISTWGTVFAAISPQLEAQRLRNGQRLRVLTETVTSPTMAYQLRGLLDVFPEAKWHQYEPVNRDYLYAGARRAFGENVTTQYRFDQAQIILALAIVFGNINNLNSRVSKLKATQLNYGLLTDLNTRPRTTYLARLRHPHPDLAQHEERG